MSAYEPLMRPRSVIADELRAGGEQREKALKLCVAFGITGHEGCDCRICVALRELEDES